VVKPGRVWYRNSVIGQAIVERLEPLAKGWRKALKERGEQALAELRAFHEQAGQQDEQSAAKHKARKKK
jgi:hypothetical protein